MREVYSVKYRQPGQIFWRSIKNVKGDAIEDGMRWFMTETDELYFISLQAEVHFSNDRQKVITYRLSKEAGQPIQRA